MKSPADVQLISERKRQTIRSEKPRSGEDCQAITVPRPKRRLGFVTPCSVEQLTSLRAAAAAGDECLFGFIQGILHANAVLTDLGPCAIGGDIDRNRPLGSLLDQQS